MSCNNRHSNQQIMEDSSEKHSSDEESAEEKDLENTDDQENIISEELPPLIKIEFGGQEDSEDDSSTADECTGYEADVGSHDETSFEIEDDEEVQETKEVPKNDSAIDENEAEIRKKKERIAWKSQILIEADKRLKEAQKRLVQKLGQTIPEKEIEPLCEELQKRMENINVRQQEAEDAMTENRESSSQEEPQWLTELMEEVESVFPPFPPNSGNAKAQSKRQRGLRRIRSYSVAESQCELGEVHLVTVKRFIGDVMDKHLDTIGFVKRSTPHDGDSLYRCICEELFLCQRKEDIQMVKKWITRAVEMDYKIQMIQKGRVEKKGNEDELRVATSLFRAQISVYKEPNKMPVFYNPPGGMTPEIEISMCESEPNHFERVTERATAEKLGIAQAVVYQMLCAELYGLTKASIRYCIKRVRMDMGITRWKPTRAWSSSLTAEHLPDSQPHYHPNHCKFHPPLQYSKIKYMDPRIYRNTPCDLYAKEHPPPEAKTTPNQFPLGSTVLTKIRGVVQQAEVVENYDSHNKVVRFADGVIALVPIAGMRNGVAKVVPKRLPSLPNLPSKNGFAHLPFLSPPVSRLPSPVNYILEPLTWDSHSPSPLMSPMHSEISPPGMVPTGPMESWNMQPQAVSGSTSGPPIATSTPISPGSFHDQNQPVMSSVPPRNAQRSFSVPEQIMANYNKFPMDLSGYSQQPATFPVRSSTSQPINNGGLGTPIPQPYSPISVASSCGDESVFFPSSPKFPMTNVPYFNYEEMKQVRHNCCFSMRIDGSDLPQDAVTLRYFYNLGVNCARRMNGQTHDGEIHHGSTSTAVPPPPHMIPGPPGNFVTPMMTPVMYGMQPLSAYGIPINAPPPVMYAVPPPPVGPTYVNGTTYYPPQEPVENPGQ